MNRKIVFPCCMAVMILFAAPLLRAQSGTISANPNPCEIYLIQDLCTSTIVWSSQGVSLVQVWVATSTGEALFATTGPGGPIQRLGSGITTTLSTSTTIRAADAARCWQA